MWSVQKCCRASVRDQVVEVMGKVRWSGISEDAGRKNVAKPGFAAMWCFNVGSTVECTMSAVNPNGPVLCFRDKLAPTVSRCAVDCRSSSSSISSPTARWAVEGAV